MGWVAAPNLTDCVQPAIKLVQELGRLPVTLTSADGCVLRHVKRAVVTHYSAPPKLR